VRLGWRASLRRIDIGLEQNSVILATKGGGDWTCKR
jgi:hypothetical protein